MIGHMKDNCRIVRFVRISFRDCLPKRDYAGSQIERMQSCIDTKTKAKGNKEMTVTRIQSNQRMSQCVVHGDTIYTAGQVASGGSVTEQTKGILAQIDGLLAEAGSDKTKILSATIWLCSMDDFAEMNAVWDAWVPQGNTPCRAAVESPRLATPEFKVEIGVIAAR